MKTRKSLILSAILAIPILASIPAGAQEGVQLKAKLNAGNKYTIRQTMDTAMPMPGGAGEMKMNMIYDTAITVSADEEKAGHKVVSVGFDRIKVKADMAGQTLEYDSGDEEKQHPMLKMSMDPMKDLKFAALYDEKDEFVKVLEAPKAGAGGMGMGGMGEAEMRQLIDSMVNHGFPEKPVKVGDTWTHEIDMPMGQMGGEMKSKMTYTYAGEGERNGKKHPKFTFKGSVGGEANAGGNALIQFKDSEISGWMLFDQEEGMASYSETDMKLTMSVGGAEGAELDTSTKAVVEMIKKEKLEAK